MRRFDIVIIGALAICSILYVPVGFFGVRKMSLLSTLLLFPLFLPGTSRSTIIYFAFFFLFSHPAVRCKRLQDNWRHSRKLSNYQHSSCHCTSLHHDHCDSLLPYQLPSCAHSLRLSHLQPLSRRHSFLLLPHIVSRRQRERTDTCVLASNYFWTVWTHAPPRYLCT